MKATIEFNQHLAVHTARLIIRTARFIGKFSRVTADDVASMCQIVGDGWVDPSITDVLDLGGPEIFVTDYEAKRIVVALAGRSCEGGVVHLYGVFSRRTGSNLALVGLAFPVAWEAERTTDSRFDKLEDLLDGCLEATVYQAAKAILGGYDDELPCSPTMH